MNTETPLPPDPEVCEDCDPTRCECAGTDDAPALTTITVAGGLL